MNKETIGKMVRFHRQKATLSQEGLAELAGVGKTAVFDIEKGKTTVRLSTLLSILEVLNIKIVFHSPLKAEFEKHINEKK